MTRSSKGAIFTVEAIYPKHLFSSHKVNARVLNELKRQRIDMYNYFATTTEYWKHQPKFDVRIKYAGGDIRLIGQPIVTSDAGNHWAMLNRGTKVRHAVLSNDWESKTVPGDPWHNIPGKGQKLYVDRKLRLPGIKPREWTLHIRNVMIGPFVDGIEEAIRRGLQE